ncbi:MAG: MBL fold metallo-hydrolase [Acidimicrobiales bacterium]|nr:MBL fold metallo-hydrolase [Acidimicrobiales bacterium]RZV43245.1 MAG: MBL fold metallo-hydrolase [Acidimicrobiales bacterium]
MIFEQHYLDCLSQASYFIGDESSGKAVVVDPRRDIAPYLETAAEHDMKITHILETHFHADFLSGHLELANATGAEIGYGAGAVTEFASTQLADGHIIDLGSVQLQILHTPGHTPESISIVVHENGTENPPTSVLTGDTLFIGDVGRPDLLSSKGVTSEELASQLYDSLHNKLMTLPDETLLYPGHGAGSACGKNLSSDTVCSIGRQRETNYAVQPMSKEDFIAAVTEGQSAAPAYFAYDAQLNRELHTMLDEHQPPASLTIDEAIAHQTDGAVILDSRDPTVFAAGHIAGSINIGLAGRFAEYAGGAITPDTPIVLVADVATETQGRVRLARIGYDNVVGALVDVADTMAANGEHIAHGNRIDVHQLRSQLDENAPMQLVDVRQPGETEGGIIEGAVIVPLTQLDELMGTLDANAPTVVYCAGGYRSSIAGSRMMRAGFTDVTDVVGGYTAWQTAFDSVPG